jgi:hypothetical protein
MGKAKACFYPTVQANMDTRSRFGPTQASYFQRLRVCEYSLSGWRFSGKINSVDDLVLLFDCLGNFYVGSVHQGCDVFPMTKRETQLAFIQAVKRHDDLKASLAKLQRKFKRKQREYSKYRYEGIATAFRWCSEDLKKLLE